MQDLMDLLSETGLPFAYDHFAEGESPEPPFITFLIPASDKFCADGVVLYAWRGDPADEAAGG